MYFESREYAGQKLAAALFEKYRYENCAVVALSDGGVVIGEQVSGWLHCSLMMLVVEEIDIPGEGMSFGGISQRGDFTYNSDISSSEMQEYTSEYHGYLEEQKREAFQRINRLVGDGGLVDDVLLRDHTVILVSDGFSDAASLDVALDFLKPIRINRLVVAAPVASMGAVNKLHMVADELHILDVKDNYLETKHYYDKDDEPSRELAIEKINKNIVNWR